MNKRLGFIGIIVQQRGRHAGAVNALLTRYGHLVRARTGVPDPGREGGVIALIVEATTDEIGDLTGKLGQLEGVTVKSALAGSAADASCSARP